MPADFRQSPTPRRFQFSYAKMLAMVAMCGVVFAIFRNDPPPLKLGTLMSLFAMSLVANAVLFGTPVGTTLRQIGIVFVVLISSAAAFVGACCPIAIAVVGIQPGRGQTAQEAFAPMVVAFWIGGLGAVILGNRVYAYLRKNSRASLIADDGSAIK